MVRSPNGLFQDFRQKVLKLLLELYANTIYPLPNVVHLKNAIDSTSFDSKLAVWPPSTGKFATVGAEFGCVIKYIAGAVDGSDESK